jgi:hypothetical protein
MLSGAPERLISTEPDLPQAGARRIESKWDGPEHAAEQHGTGPSWAGAEWTEPESERSPQRGTCPTRARLEPSLNVEGIRYGMHRADPRWAGAGRTEHDSDGVDPKRSARNQIYTRLEPGR